MKINKLNGIALSVVAIFTLAGCGSSDSPAVGTVPAGTTQTAYFVDSAVVGATYNNGATTGITGTGGSFQFYEGVPVTFSIGNATLGSVTPTSGAKITPANMASGDGITRIAQFLQSLDADGNPDNGIEITQATRDAIRTAINVQSISESDLATVVTSAGHVLKSSSSALAHLNATIAKLKAVVSSTSSPSSPTTPSGTTSATPVATVYDYDMSGTITDGRLKNATVFIDVNENGTFDDGVDYGPVQ